MKISYHVERLNLLELRRSGLAVLSLPAAGMGWVGLFFI